MENTGTLKVNLPSECEISLTRVFQAPRQLVYEVFSKPEFLRRWFGPRGWRLDTCDVDARVGGGFRFVLSTPDGHRVGRRGIYREIAPPERCVHVESFDDFPGEAVVSSVFTEDDGATTFQATIRYPTREARDAVLQSGMEHGAAESYDQLAELLETITRVNG